MTNRKIIENTIHNNNTGLKNFIVTVWRQYRAMPCHQDDTKSGQTNSTKEEAVTKMSGESGRFIHNHGMKTQLQIIIRYCGENLYCLINIIAENNIN